MFFWFKKKKIVLDCFTANPFAYEYCKPDFANKYYPEWYKDLPGFFTSPSSFNNKNATLKHCRGFSDLYQHAIILPYWDTIMVDISDNVTRQTFITELKDSLSEKLGHLHNPIQLGSFFKDSDLDIFKLGSPWFFKTNKLVKFSWQDVPWHYNTLNRFVALPAIVNYKYQFNTDINLIFEYRNKSTVFNLYPGDPLVMLVPLTDEDIVIKTHQIDHMEVRKYAFKTLDDTSKFYLRRKKLMDLKVEREKNKCPFGFGEK
jgi:hypothetical protein